MGAGYYGTRWETGRTLAQSLCFRVHVGTLPFDTARGGVCCGGVGCASAVPLGGFAEQTFPAFPVDASVEYYF